MDIAEVIENWIIKIKDTLSKIELLEGEIIYNNGQCQILSQSSVKFELIVSDSDSKEYDNYSLDVNDECITPILNGKNIDWERNSYACLLQINNEMHLLDVKEYIEHKKYSREGMVQRVLKERMIKAERADYKMQWASNIYGTHILTNENGVKYEIFLRDFKKEIGYSNSLDSKHNKLGTTKHIMFAFKSLKENNKLFKKLDKTFPFIEIFCDPLNDYKVSWFYPHDISVEEKLLLSRYFKNQHYIEDEFVSQFIGFIDEAEKNRNFNIRPEVYEKLEDKYEAKMLLKLKETKKVDYSKINANLYDYQKEGIDFVLYKKSAIIADEMGLGKTIQAIGAAVLKKEIFGFKKTLVVCPASIKEQWKNEIEKFSDEKAIVIQGSPDERKTQYEDGYYFYIVNYETLRRDYAVINKENFDFLILDEAQRAKNYETKTAASIKRVETKHKLIITGTPIENKLIDIFSIMSILDPYFLGPLWEFSYQYCLFDPTRHNKINGYYNLQHLNNRLSSLLLRREKRKVLDQLPDLQQHDVFVELSPLQEELHSNYSRGISKIIHKRYLTPFDLQRLQILLANMRMVCDSTYLIDDQTNESPKLEELKYTLLEKLDIQNKDNKIIIFSEWIKVHKLIGKMLRDNNIGFVELNGKIPVKSRGDLIEKFETNSNYKVFLSTEAGGSGLNLQMADTLINFELPWNPAKKNQRIGRIDRLGQTSKKLTIINFITQGSIEQKIATGLLIKQNLFDGVLGDNKTDFVDFTTKGRSQFIHQLEEFVAENENKIVTIDDEIKNNLIEEEVEDRELEFVSTEDSNNEDLGAALHEKDTSDSNDNSVTKTSTDSSVGGNGSEDNPETSQNSPSDKAAELEQVMNNGLQFFSGLIKMSTGKDVGLSDQKIEVNKETGEVTMKFKMPM